MQEFNETENFFCTDCQAHRNQKLKGKRTDNSVFYICSVCGCENDFEVEDKKYEIKKYCK